MTSVFNILNLSHSKSLQLLLTAIVILALNACSTIRSNVDTASNADFDSLRTFAWLADEPLLASNPVYPQVINPINEQRIRAAVDHELESKGYIRGGVQQADFFVSVSVGARDKLSVTDFGHPGFHSGFCCRRGFGGGVNVRSYTEGTLTVDIFDAKTSQAIWHGSASRRVGRTDNPATVINEIVMVILEEFPSGRHIG